MIDSLKKVETWKWVVLICFILFCALLFKDPFSQRTLIPNLEPYPDTLNYITGARSLISGHGFTLTREGRSMKVNVPPIYSLTLAPAFLIYSDPRTFYFVNLLFAFATFGMLII